jgi:hypothetical protein
MKGSAMDEDRWKAFCFDFLRTAMSGMYDDVTPKEVVEWLLWSWHFDKERPSKDEVLRHCLEHTVAELKSQLPTWWQIHEAGVTGKNPYDCERKVTPRPPGAGLFVGAFFDELRPHVVKNGLSLPPEAAGT